MTLANRDCLEKVKGPLEAAGRLRKETRKTQGSPLSHRMMVMEAMDVPLHLPKV
jgi:hypothetical protein